MLLHQGLVAREAQQVLGCAFISLLRRRHGSAQMLRRALALLLLLQRLRRRCFLHAVHVQKPEHRVEGLTDDIRAAVVVDCNLHARPQAFDGEIVESAPPVLEHAPDVFDRR